MLSPLRQSAGVPMLPRMHFVLAAVAIQPDVVLAQSQSSDSYYYYWLTPGRIVGIAIGGLALILFFLSLLLLARRRCLHRSRSRVAPSSSFTSGAVPASAAARPPPTYPAWTGSPTTQQPIQTTTSFRGPVPSSGWYYPSSYGSPVPPYRQPKPVTPQGPSSSNSAGPRTQPGRAQGAISPRQEQGVAPPDRRPAPSVRTHEQVQGQGAAPLPPPHHPSHATGAPSPGAGREESPPPYSPTGLPPPDTSVTR